MSARGRRSRTRGLERVGPTADLSHHPRYCCARWSLALYARCCAQDPLPLCRSPAVSSRESASCHPAGLGLIPPSPIHHPRHWTGRPTQWSTTQLASDDAQGIREWGRSRLPMMAEGSTGTTATRFATSRTCWDTIIQIWMVCIFKRLAHRTRPYGAASTAPSTCRGMDSPLSTHRNGGDLARPPPPLIHYRLCAGLSNGTTFNP